MLVRPLATSLAVSPPLTAGPQHFEIITEALSVALDQTAANDAEGHVPSVRQRRRLIGAGSDNDSLVGGEAKATFVATRTACLPERGARGCPLWRS